MAVVKITFDGSSVSCTRCCYKPLYVEIMAGIFEGIEMNYLILFRTTILLLMKDMYNMWKKNICSRKPSLYMLDSSKYGYVILMHFHQIV